MAKRERELVGKAWNSTLNVYRYPATTTGRFNSKKPNKSAKPQSGTPIKRRSDKRAKQEREYSKLRVEFLTANPDCQVGVDGCTGEASEVHHKAGRIGDLLTDVSKFCAACHNCHVWVENNPKESMERGFILSRLKRND